MNQSLKNKHSATMKKLLLVGVCLLAIATSGCAEGRSSTHELDHEVPPHWPQGLADAANKIETRLSIIRSVAPEANVARGELVEIVDWLPEVAADTPLEEATWNEVNMACAKANALLTRSEASAADTELQALCVRLRELDQGTPP